MSLIGDLCTIGFNTEIAKLIGNAIAAVTGTVLGAAWVPTYSTSGGGMTFTETTRNLAIWFKVFGWVFFSIDVYGDVGTANGSEVRFSLPATAASAFGALSCNVSVDGATSTAGTALFLDTTAIKVRRYDNAVWTVGSARAFRVTGFYKAAA